MRGLRGLAFVLLVSACAGKLDGNMRPAVMNRLDALPGDADKQHAILDQANTTTGPETPRGSQPALSRKAKKVETGAAWAAAIIGQAFSKSENVTLGASTTFDENRIFEDSTPKPKPAPPPAEKVDAKTLVPWIQLTPAATPAPN